MLSILDAETATLKIDGLDHLSEVAGSHTAFMGEFIGLVAVILIFGTPVIIVLAVLRHRANRQRLINEMVLKLADKGQPIPPELFIEPVRPKSDLRRGVILIGVGLGLIGFFYFNDDHDGVGIGFIPMMIGLGYLVSWKLEQGKKSP